jgi:hypothetical protein
VLWPKRVRRRIRNASRPKCSTSSAAPSANTILPASTSRHRHRRAAT